MRQFRTAAAVVALLTTLVLVGCGGTSSSSTSASAGPKKKVVYVPGLTGNPFYSTVACGAKSVAAKLNVDFSVQGAPQFDLAAQTSIVNALITSKPDAIMISITDSKGMIAPLARAKASGIKVIAIDGDLADTSIAVTNIQSDNVKGGALAADKLGQLMGNQGSVVLLSNAAGNPIGEQRLKGFEDELKSKYPGVHDLGVQYSKNQTSQAALIVSSTAVAHPDLKGVYTTATNNTEGAITGVRESNKVGQVNIVGYDTSDPIVEALHQKTLAADVVQYPFGEGKLGVQSAVDAINGKSVPREQNQPFVIATPQNVDTPQVQQYIYKLNC